MTIKHHTSFNFHTNSFILKSDSELLRIKGTPPSFLRFSDLEDGSSDRIEIFITDRPPKMMRHVFEEKII
jgi:hypothetical protein